MEPTEIYLKMTSEECTAFEHDQSSYFCRGPDDFCWGPAPLGPTLVMGLEKSLTDGGKRYSGQLQWLRGCFHKLSLQAPHPLVSALGVCGVEDYLRLGLRQLVPQ